MSDPPNPSQEIAPNNVDEILGLLDFYSSRAVAHASFFVASIFGLVTFSSITSQAFKISGFFYVPAFLLFLGLAYMGYHALMRFGFYAAIAQNITVFGLKDEEVMKSISTSKSDKIKNLWADFSKNSDDQDRLLVFTRIRKYLSNRESYGEKAKNTSKNQKSVGLRMTSWLLWGGYWSAMIFLSTLVFYEYALSFALILLGSSIELTITPTYIKLDTFSRIIASARAKILSMRKNRNLL